MLQNFPAPQSFEYQPRIYRELMNRERFRSWTLACLESDLWIGVDAASFIPEMTAFTHKKLLQLRKALQRYALRDSAFLTALSPYPVLKPAPALVRRMFKAGSQAGVGPMAAVAGGIAQALGEALKFRYKVREVIVENGGDIYLSFAAPLTLAVHAGEAQLSGQAGIILEPGYSPLGVCTSSGRLGPSLSLGNSDAVMVSCKDTALADAYATALGNKVKHSNDIPAVLAEAKALSKILAIVIIIQDHIGIQGVFKFKPFQAMAPGSTAASGS